MDDQPWIGQFVSLLTAKGAISSRAVAAAFRLAGKDWNPGDVIEHDRDRPQLAALDAIYSDVALITRIAGGRGSSSSSQPSLMAEMLELLDLRPGMRVLEIGSKMKVRGSSTLVCARSPSKRLVGILSHKWMPRTGIRVA